MAKAKPRAGKPAAQTAPQGGRPTVSLCMMVKNEEKRLAAALRSAAPWVDEIIVVDTGSTDRTVEIAREFGAKIYHHPWEYNFSKHRNQSISYATGDWLLILDADEELDQETAPLIKEMVKAPREVSGFLFELYNAVAPGGETFILHPRMFRNNIGFHYEGHVHNRPILPGAIARTKVKLRHYGYNEDPATMEAKHQRRLDMIRKWAQDEPDNFNPHSYLAHTLASRPETQVEALEEALIALRLLESHPTPEKHYPHVYYPLLQSLFQLNRDAEVVTHAEDCLRRADFFGDATFFMVMSLYRLKRWTEVCEKAQLFLDQQAQCLEHPDKFIFFENLTINQQHQVALRWVVAAGQAGDFDQARRAFALLFTLREAEPSSKLAVKDLLAFGRYDLAQELCDEAARREPDWPWPKLIGRLAGEKLREIRAQSLREDGVKALEEGRSGEAARMLVQAREQAPLNAEVLLGLGRVLDGEGRTAEAEALLMQGLNAHPGHAWAWKRLGDACFAEGNHLGAAACYRRYLSLVREDPATVSRLAVCERRLAEAGPSVGQRPPRLLVFLVGGLTPQMIEQAGPHFLLGRAWGGLQDPGGGLDSGLSGWATLYTATPPGVHGLAGELDWARPQGLADLAVPSMWELMPAECSLGFVAAPLVQPSSSLPGWVLAGQGAGLLTPALARPRELAPLALAGGYRSDFALNEFEAQVMDQRLQNDVRQEAFLFQTERNKITTAVSLPAVDVLVVGFTGLEHVLRAHGLASHQAFYAHQQVYAWIETLLAGLKPANFAVLSQRGYASGANPQATGGFYCLSWLRGENGQAQYAQVAPEIIKLMGGDPSGLGRPR